MSVPTVPAVFKLRRGDTFAKACRFKQDGTNPTDVTDVQIDSQIRRKTGELVATLVITKRDQTTQTGVYLAQHNGSTLGWPRENLEWDIFYRWTTPDGVYGTHTEKMIIDVDGSVTRV